MMSGGRFLVRAGTEGLPRAAQIAEACIKAVAGFVRIDVSSGRGASELVRLWDPESGMGTAPFLTAVINYFATISAYQLERFDIHSFLGKFRTPNGKPTVKSGHAEWSVFETHGMDILNELYRSSWLTIEKMSLGLVRVCAYVCIWLFVGVNWHTGRHACTHYEIRPERVHIVHTHKLMNANPS